MLGISIFLGVLMIGRSLMWSCFFFLSNIVRKRVCREVEDQVILTRTNKGIFSIKSLR